MPIEGKTASPRLFPVGTSLCLFFDVANRNMPALEGPETVVAGYLVRPIDVRDHKRRYLAILNDLMVDWIVRLPASSSNRKSSACGNSASPDALINPILSPFLMRAPGRTETLPCSKWQF